MTISIPGSSCLDSQSSKGTVVAAGWGQLGPQGSSTAFGRWLEVSMVPGRQWKWPTICCSDSGSAVHPQCEIRLPGALGPQCAPCRPVVLEKLCDLSERRFLLCSVCPVPLGRPWNENGPVGPVHSRSLFSSGCYCGYLQSCQLLCQQTFQPHMDI